MHSPSHHPHPELARQLAQSLYGRHGSNPGVDEGVDVQDIVTSIDKNQKDVTVTRLRTTMNMRTLLFDGCLMVKAIPVVSETLLRVRRVAHCRFEVRSIGLRAV